MYNLFVSGSEEVWDGEPYFLELDKCIREYTDEEITERLGGLTPENLVELKRMPSIFAYETACAKDPHFGLVREVVTRQGQARIEYELIPLDRFLTVDDLSQRLAFDLDIAAWEMNRTQLCLGRKRSPKEVAQLINERVGIMEGR